MVIFDIESINASPLAKLLAQMAAVIVDSPALGYLLGNAPPHTVANRNSSRYRLV